MIVYKANSAYLEERTTQAKYFVKLPIHDNVISNAIFYTLVIQLGTDNEPEECSIEVDADSFLRACLYKQRWDGTAEEARDFETFVKTLPLKNWRYRGGKIERTLTAKEFFSIFRPENEKLYSDVIDIDDIDDYSYIGDLWFDMQNADLSWDVINWGRGNSPGQRCLPIIEELVNELKTETALWVSQLEYAKSINARHGNDHEP